MDTLAAFAKRSDASIDEATAGIQRLKISFSKKGKENASDTDSVARIQECLKAAQKRLAQPQEDVQQLASLCQSCLRLLEQQSGAKTLTKLHTLAYTTIRLLISAKAFAPALEEALRLHQSLSKELKAYRNKDAEDDSSLLPTSLSTNIVNLAVGAILTMALCFAEGAVKDGKQLSYVLSAADTAQNWFRLLPAQESSKHSQTLFKSLYRGSTKLLERKDWKSLQGACLVMISKDCGGDRDGDVASTSVPLALGATAKLAAHVPEPHSVHLLSKIILNCPSITSSISLLEKEQRTSSFSSMSSSAAAALETLSAALGPGNSLRKRVSTVMHGPAETIIDALGGEDASLETAAALDVVARIISVGHMKITAASVEAAPTTPLFSEYAHSAAVALACSARIRSACIQTGSTIDWQTSYTLAAERVLGWRWPKFHFPSSLSLSLPPSPGTMLSPQELVWLSSSLYNVGIDLLTRKVALLSSIAPLTASLEASITALFMTTGLRQNRDTTTTNRISNENETSDSEDSSTASAEIFQGISDVIKRASVLIEALGKAGKDAAVLTTTAADVLAVVFSSCPKIVPSSAAYSTLVGSLVSTTIKQQINGTVLLECPPSVTKRRGGGRSMKNAAARATEAAAAASRSQSVTAAVQNHRAAQIFEHCIAMVARAELVSWAEALSSGLPPPSGAEAAAAATAQHLLDAVYPSNTAPLDHVRTLILVEQLKLDNHIQDKKNEGTCIERAQHVLRPLVKKGDVEALILDALMAAQGVLREAQTLVEATIDHQKVLQQEKMERVKRDPSKVHADDTQQDDPLSATTTAAAAAAFVESQAIKWSYVLGNAQEVTEKLCFIVEHSSSLSSSSSSALFKQEDGTALIVAARELCALIGIHGLVEQEQQALEIVAVLEELEIGSNSTGGVLLDCVLPAFDASADGAALEAAATDLAVATTNSRNSATVLQRAELSMAASLAYAASGDVVQALHCAGEGHRLLGSLVQNGQGAAGASSTATATTSSVASKDGWWKLSITYCRSLLLVGRLFDSAGMMDEGIIALKEGQRVAEAMGSSLLRAAFTSQLAQIYAISGQPMAASNAVNSAKNSLESSTSSFSSGDDNDSIVKQWIVASVACAETRVHAASGEYTQAMLCCHKALDALEEAQHFDLQCAVKPHVDALLAAAHSARLEVLKAEGREIEEIGNAAKEALMHIDSKACIAFGAAPRAGLLLTQAAVVAAAAEAVEAGSEKLSSASSAARLWVPAATAEATTISQHGTYLWQALVCSRGAPHVHRFAAFKLAPLVASSGHLHLAALLLHIGAGSTLQLQHQLVLHARERNAQRRQRASASTLVGAGQKEAETAEAAAAKALVVLDSDLDWELIKSMFASNAASRALNKPTKQVTVTRGGSTRGTAKPSSVAIAAEEKMHAALTVLNSQAAHTLHKWLSELPSDTPVCTLGARDDQDCLVISRLALAPTTNRNSNNRRREIGEQEVIPIILDIPIKAYGTSTSQHPIRALALDADDEEKKDKSCCSSAVESAVHEMERVLEDSTHSMKHMATDTRDQQREWWRTRVGLDDSLAALLQHLGEEWLGPWKCLLIGPPLASSTTSPSEDAVAAPVEALRERVSAVLQQLLSIAGVGRELENRSSSLEAVNELAIPIVHSMQIMSATEQRQAAMTLCTALLECSRDSCAEKRRKDENIEDFKMEMVAKAVKLLSKAADMVTSSSATVPAAATAAAMPLATLKKKAAAYPLTTRKVTFFQDDNEDEASSPSSPEPRTQLRQAPSFNNIDIDNSLDGGGGGSNLCARFEALAVAGGGNCASMATPLPARPPGAATIRAKKHKSRLALMQGAVTPAAKSGRKPLRPTTTTAGGGFCLEDEDTSSVIPATISKMNIAAATAPRLPRPLATPATAFTMPARARNLSSSGAAAPLLNAAPVVAIFSPELQSLPWESAPGLVLQQIYRLHALPCAAASASAQATAITTTAAAPPQVDLSSAYYTINPSGDLQSTQDTFETWFKGLRGWSGRAGSPPSSSELAHALQSKELFVYCGHGGGEQYIPTAKLRGLPRCAASLLMGCSSGRLRGGGKTSISPFSSISSSSSSSNCSGGRRARQQQQQRYHYYYEPTGVVLAYLLAGCPAAVANLWDVTDRDIDRFAQAVLMKWFDGDSSSSSSSNNKDSSKISNTTRSGDVAAAVAAARGACKLPCLIGAAPVCYGVPTTVMISK